MRWLWIICFSAVLQGSEDFITKDEYAKQLYNNPRGISCAECHGAKGEGRAIARYKHKNEAKTFAAPAINNVDFASFKKALNERKRGMPRYFLTDDEIRTLYYYLQQRQGGKK